VNGRALASRCRAGVVAALVALLFAPEAQATPAQGYTFTLTPLLQHRAQWLLLHGFERSDPNTMMADRVAPAMAAQRHWWIVVDAAGRIRCSSKMAEAPTGPASALTATVATRLRAGCPALRRSAALRPGATWVAAAVSEAGAASWSERQVCASARCVAAARPQRTLFDKVSSPPGSSERAAPAPAPARCVADRWLVVSNSDDGSGQTKGARFAGVPPPLRTDIVGYEFEAVDGVAVLPPSMRCKP
jgi:hypothetical protein